MTPIAIIAAILLPLLWAMIASLNRGHHEDTGVDAPNRKAMARIRRNARQNGTSEMAAYEQWLANKRRRAPKRSTLSLPEGRYVSPSDQATAAAANNSSRSFADAFPASVPPLKDAEPLAISIKSMKPPLEGSTKYDFEFDFHCRDCGGFVLNVDDAQEKVTCKACGKYLGEFPAIRARCEQLGQSELRFRGLMQGPAS